MAKRKAPASFLSLRFVARRACGSKELFFFLGWAASVNSCPDTCDLDLMILEKSDFTHPLLRKGWGTRRVRSFI